MSERVIRHPDGTTEHVSEGGGTTVIERGGSGAAWLIGLAALILAVVGGYFLLNKDRNDTIQTESVQAAAKSVGSAADKVGDSAERAADEVTKP